MDRLLKTGLHSSLLWSDDPDDAVPGLEEPPIVGPVPMQWRRFVRARHLDHCYARIARCIANPVETEARLGLRRVAVLGQVVFEIDARGFVRAYLWVRRDGALCCLRANDEDISVGDTPYRWTWLDLFRRSFQSDLAARLGCRTRELEGYATWAFRQFRRKLQREVDLRSMRERIQAALGLDPLAVQVARRIRLTPFPKGVATLREYNHAIAHLPAYRKLMTEAPNIVPLYAAHADELARHGDREPAQLLKRHLIEEYGVRPATWALAHRIRPRWLYLATSFYPNSSQGGLEDATVDLLKLMQAIGCRTAPPRWYLWNLLQAFGHPGRRWASYAGEYEHRGAAMRRLTALIEAADEAERSAMRARIFEVLRWIIDVDAHTLRGVTRVSWRWFAKRAANWRNHQERLAAAEPSEWAVPFDSRRSQGHVVKVLRNGRELLEEGRAMSHCIDRYAEHCVRGVYLAVSIRRPDRTRPIATAAIAFNRGRWSLTEVAGACNSVPRPIAVRLAAETARAINMLGWRSPSSMNDQRKSEPSSDDPAEGADNPCEGGDGGQCEEHR